LQGFINYIYVTISSSIMLRREQLFDER